MTNYLEFEVELRDIEPRIWRRFLVRSPGTLYDLHLAIQACGWETCHLWFFGTDYWHRVAMDHAIEEEPDAPDADDVPLSRHFKRKGDRLLYLYDYGDDWHHDVVFLGRRKRDADAPRILLAGERAFPPEDAGGVPGYERLAEYLKTGKDPEEDEHVDLGAWLGDWTPERFDLEEETRRFPEEPRDD